MHISILFLLFTQYMWIILWHKPAETKIKQQVHLHEFLRLTVTFKQYFFCPVSLFYPVSMESSIKRHHDYVRNNGTHHQLTSIHTNMLYTDRHFYQSSIANLTTWNTENKGKPWKRDCFSVGLGADCLTKAALLFPLSTHFPLIAPSSLHSHVHPPTQPFHLWR